MTNWRASTNVDTETGIHYGVISQRSVDPDALDDIFQNGDDICYGNQRDDLVKALRSAVAEAADVQRHNELKADVLDLIDDIADSLMEDHECDDCPRRYEDRKLGLVVQTMPNLSCLWVFKSPVTKMVRECSPCVPNAGDLDSGEGSLETYALPEDWLCESEVLTEGVAGERW